LIVNKKLEERYAAKKTKMAKECGGEDNVNEIFVWHGSSFENYEEIMKNGLKIGGVDVDIANAAVHGYGVYSATTPDVPITYARDSRFVACFLGLKGRDSGGPVSDTIKLDNGKVHSYGCRGNWVIFFTKEQLLPRFLVEYKKVAG
jgi:Poly(ADP-ribose) polymerase catalytic domain.